MSRVEEFDAFYDSTRQYVLHLTYALCGDLGLATAAVKSAYAETWQSWPKLRSRDAMGFVRSEAWRQTVLHRGPHLIRRKQSDTVDQALLEALRDLPGNARRLLVLQTIGELYPNDAAREVGVTEETAATATIGARAAMEKRLGVDRVQVDARLRELRAVSDQVILERPSLARRRARRRGRRRTGAIVAASVLAVAAAGVIVTQGGPLDNAADASGGAFRALPPVDDLPIGEDDMLDESQISSLGHSGKWQTVDTVTDMSQRDSLSTCPPHQLADRRAAAGWVRTFEPKNSSNEFATQSIEVSREDANAERAFRKTVRWYADCAVPRLQLLHSYTADHHSRETVIMQLRRWDDPVRTYMVGITRSGLVTSALVHETEGDKSPSPKTFARAVDDTLEPACQDDNRSCTEPSKVRTSLPPETSTATGFLGVIDLPPVAKVDDVWVGTSPGSTRGNSSSTQCDKTEFTGKGVDSARAVTFLIPEADELSNTFGITQTVGSFTSNKAATAFVDDLTDRVNKCDDKNLSATVHDGSRIAGTGYIGETWRMSFEVSDKTSVSYRLGIVRAGDLVSRVLFLPDEKYDVRNADFDAMVKRAGERLRTRGDGPQAATGPADDQ